MISFGMLIGPLSLAAGILLLLIGLAAFLWVSGKIEGYDPVNEMLTPKTTATSDVTRTHIPENRRKYGNVNRTPDPRTC